jgi:pimeloyl-ACP methyl ester carboxylesterase
LSWITVGNHKLEYEWIGPSPDRAPTIVFLHEGLGSVAMWRDFPERVAAVTGLGALIYSRAGYGTSDPISLPRPVSFMHDEALKVLPDILDSFKIQDAILFGHSDGGSVALIHAGSEKAKNVRALILEAPHVFVEDLSIEGIVAAKADYENGSLRSSLQRYHGANVENTFRGWNDVWLSPDFRSWNIESYLPNIKVPVLLFQGENDEYGTLKQVEAIKLGCGGPVQTVVLPNCGHDPHREYPKRVLEDTGVFLKDVTNRELNS